MIGYKPCTNAIVAFFGYKLKTWKFQKKIGKIRRFIQKLMKIIFPNKKYFKTKLLACMG
jgi:hypothetical protein